MRPPDLYMIQRSDKSSQGESCNPVQAAAKVTIVPVSSEAQIKPQAISDANSTNASNAYFNMPFHDNQNILSD